MRIARLSWAALALAAAGGLAGCVPSPAESQPLPASYLGASLGAPRHLASIAARRHHRDRRMARRPHPLFEEMPDATEWFNPPLAGGE